MPARRLAWRAQRQRSFLLGLAPAVLVLALITIAPTIYLVLTSLTPLNLTLPATAWDSVPRPATTSIWPRIRASRAPFGSR